MSAVSVNERPTVSARETPPIDLNVVTIIGNDETTGHAFRLKGSASSRTSLLGSRTLALQGAEPTYAAQYATLPPTVGQSLLTEIPDSAKLKVTLGVVFRYAGGTAGFTNLWNNRVSSGGLGIFLSTDTLQINLGTNTTIVPGLKFAAGVWHFLGVSLDMNLTSGNLKSFGKSQPVNTTDVATYQPNAGTKLAVGQQYGASTVRTWDCAYAFAYNDQFANDATFAAMLARVEAKMALDGITIASATSG